MVKILEYLFIDLCKDFYEKNNFLYFTSESNKKYVVVKMDHRLFSLEFYYNRKESVYIPASTIYCCVKLNKNSVVHYHLADILGFLNAEDFRCMCYSYIETPERMDACFESLGTLIKDYFTEFEKLAIDDTYIRNALFNSYTQMFKLKESSLDYFKIDIDNDEQKDFIFYQDFRDTFLVHHFTVMEAYHQFLLGDFEKSQKKYEKLAKNTYLLPYENNLRKFMSKSENHNYRAIKEECFSQKVGVKENKFSIVYFLGYGLLTWIPLSVIFCLVFILVNLILSQGVELYLGTPWIAGCISASFSALFAGLAFRNHITKIIFPKKSTEKIAADKIFVSKATSMLCIIAFIGFTCVAVYSSVMMLGCNIRFYEDYFVYNKSEYFIEEIRADYKDIRGVYLVKYWIEDDGSKLENNNYSIGMKDGDLVYLDGWNQKSVVKYLESKDCEVVVIESNKDMCDMGYSY